MSRPSGESRGLKRPCSPSPRRTGRDPAPTVRSRGTSTENVRTSGSLSTSRGRRTSPPTRSPPSTLSRQPPTSEAWQSQLFSWDEVAKRFDLPKDRYTDFEFLMYLNIFDPYVENYVKFNLGIDEPRFTRRLQKHSSFYKQLNSPKNVQDIVENGQYLF